MVAWAILARAVNALPGRKRWLFAGVLALGLWLFVEFAAFVAFRAVDGRFFDLAHLRAERAEILGVFGEPGSEPNTPEEPRSPIDEQAVHPYVGFVFDPSFAPDYSRIAVGLRKKISTWGYNDSAPPFHRRAPDRVIVGIVGGSLAMFLARDFADDLAAELARSPRFAGVEFVFVRLAVPGYKQPQQLQTLSYLLSLGAEFDILINIDGFNEVALPPRDNLRLGIHPSFPRAWATRTNKLPAPAIRRAQGEVAFLRGLRRELAGGLEGSLLRYSVMANLGWRAVDAQLRLRLARADEALASPPSEERSYTVTGPPYRAASPAAAYEDLATLWRRSSLQLDRLCRANGIEYFHFLQPNQYVPGSRVFDAAERERVHLPGSSYRLAVEAGYPLLRREGRALSEAGVRFRDLTLIFRHVPEWVYRDRCCHLLDRGNEILAREIAAFVIASWDDPPPPPRPRPR